VIDAHEKWWRDEETGDLEFETSSIPSVRRFDADSHGITDWKKVDFLFHWPDTKELWLVEVKDPDNPYGSGDPSFMIEDFKQKTLIHESLAPKAKDTFLYLLLEDTIPEGTRLIYVVLFACEHLDVRKRARYFNAAMDQLKRSLGILGPFGHGWKKAPLYLSECEILSLSDWNRHPQIGGRVRVRRLSQT